LANDSEPKSRNSTFWVTLRKKSQKIIWQDLGFCTFYLYIRGVMKIEKNQKSWKCQKRSQWPVDQYRDAAQCCGAFGSVEIIGLPMSSVMSTQQWVLAWGCVRDSKSRNSFPNGKTIVFS
jgi:hypothetical protein